jgi:dihydrofolate reductase
MSTVTCHIAMSLDGFVAGPNQSPSNPIGEGGLRLHQWAFATDSWRKQHGLDGGERNADSEVVDDVLKGAGAYIMGRKMFGGSDGPWDETWTGWWGDDPPFHAPVFVLTHHPREPLSMEGGTSFNFVTDGSSPHSSKRTRRPATGSSQSLAARAPCSNASPPGCWMSSISTSSRSSLGRGSGCSRTSAILPSSPST